MKEEKKKRLEAKLRNMLEINSMSNASPVKKLLCGKSYIIRRRKGQQDKMIKSMQRNNCTPKLPVSGLKSSTPRTGTDSR